MASNAQQSTDTGKVPHHQNIQVSNEPHREQLRTSSPTSIPVLTPAEYYSLTGAERTAYHNLQEMVNGFTEVPGLAATMPAQGNGHVSPNSLRRELASIAAPFTFNGHPAVVRVQLLPESDESNMYDGESVSSHSSEKTLDGATGTGSV